MFYMQFVLMVKPEMEAKLTVDLGEDYKVTHRLRAEMSLNV